MEISVFGMGYVGCVTLGCLSESGHNIIGVDKDAHKVKLVNDGLATIIEKDISELIKKNRVLKRIKATQDPDYAVSNSDISIIAVGTPSSDTGSLNLDFVFQVAEEIGKALTKKDEFHTVIIRSTVLPGTNKKVGDIIANVSGKKMGENFAVVSNPEFLREGTAVFDYYNPPMILLGSDSTKGIEKVKEIYSNIDSKILITDVKIAELIKYVNNTFHALKVSFANEIGNICKRLNIDSHDLMDIFIEDRKLNISPYYLKPGFAYGGSCLSKDLNALRNLSKSLDLNSPIIESIEKSNTNQKKLTLSLIKNTKLRKIGFLGISFKEGTDDIRNSPAIDLIRDLTKNNYKIKIFDEEVFKSTMFGSNKIIVDNLNLEIENFVDTTIDEVINNSEVIVICKKDKRFRLIKKFLDDKIVIDLVRLFDKVNHKNYIGLCW